MAGHETVRSTDLSALQGIFFEELDNLMALDINADDEAIVTAELRPRKCPCCGKTYRPQYKAQRTCRECLDSGRKARRSYGFAVCQRCGATFEKLSVRGKYCPKCRKRKFKKEKS